LKNRDAIEFETNPDGSTSVVIKNIGSRALPNEMEIPWDFQISTRGAVIAVFICTNLPMLQFLNKNCVLLWKDMDSTGRKDGIVVKVSTLY